MAGAGADHVLWTVPSGHVDIMRDVDGYQASGGTGVGTFRTAAGYFLVFGPASTSAPIAWRGRQVFVAGTVVSFNPNVSPFNLRVSGYRLQI